MTQTTTRPAIKKETLKPKAPATRPKSGDSPNNKTAAQVKRKGPPVKKEVQKAQDSSPTHKVKSLIQGEYEFKEVRSNAKQLELLLKITSDL